MYVAAFQTRTTPWFRQNHVKASLKSGAFLKCSVAFLLWDDRVKQDLKPPFYWERQMARIGRALLATRPTGHRHYSSHRRRSAGAGFKALSPRIVDLGLGDYCEV